MEEKIEHLIKLINGVRLEQEMHDDLKSVMTDKTESVRKNHPQGTFKRVFWEQQLENLKLKKRLQIRWHQGSMAL